MRVNKGLPDRFGPFGFLTVVLVGGQLAGADAPAWTAEPQVGIGVNIRAPDWYRESITRFDAEKLAESLQRAGATIAFTFQGFNQDHRGMSFFPTKLGPLHPNLNGRDFIAESIAACHRRGIRASTGQTLPIEKAGDFASVVIPRLEGHEIVVLE